MKVHRDNLITEMLWHAGDGGFVVVDQSDPRNVVHERFNISPLRSTQAGKFGTWSVVVRPKSEIEALTLFPK